MLTKDRGLPAWPHVMAPQKTRVVYVLLLLGIATIAFGFRLAAASGDLWLDEIWSVGLVKTVGSASAIFWGISHDNNHFLNSLWMYWVGPEASPLGYRCPAVMLGTATAVVATRMGDRANKASGLLCGLLFAIGLPFVTYGSEAARLCRAGDRHAARHQGLGQSLADPFGRDAAD